MRTVAITTARTAAITATKLLPPHCSRYLIAPHKVHSATALQPEPRALHLCATVTQGMGRTLTATMTE